ncbi:hypothetical protein [Paenibacillus aquistagni]|uniref:hypothetical protein n=1 Tax=Paenibacillus aquistagni TaxID=1852522 RepID=UPI000B4FEF45|nr:hypothetical protein [Paenibacillus aquistagni]NMM51637.1 hypothetical protein [Paenibacillus aquistagni]
MKRNKAIIVMMAMLLSLLFAVSASAADVRTDAASLASAIGYSITGQGDLTVTGYATRQAYPGTDENVRLIRTTPSGNSYIYDISPMYGIGNFSHTYHNLPQGTYHIFFPTSPWSVSNVNLQFN